MKTRIIFLLLLIVSCNSKGFNELEIIEIGEKLIAAKMYDSKGSPIDELLYVGIGLKSYINELKLNANDFKFEATEGDYMESYEEEDYPKEHLADAYLKIITDYKSIGVRLKYVSKERKYTVLGYLTIRDYSKLKVSKGPC